MIMHIPGVKQKQVDEFVQNIDIMPTILDVLKLKSDVKFEGKSLIPLVKKNKRIRDKVFSFDGLAKDIKAVRTKEKKLIIAEDPVCNICKSTHHEARIEEYDVVKDPGEENNIYDYKTRSELERFLENRD